MNVCVCVRVSDRDIQRERGEKECQKIALICFAKAREKIAILKSWGPKFNLSSWPILTLFCVKKGRNEHTHTHFSGSIFIFFPHFLFSSTPHTHTLLDPRLGYSSNSNTAQPIVRQPLSHCVQAEPKTNLLEAEIRGSGYRKSKPIVPTSKSVFPCQTQKCQNTCLDWSKTYFVLKFM